MYVIGSISKSKKVPIIPFRMRAIAGESDGVGKLQRGELCKLQKEKSDSDR